MHVVIHDDAERVREGGDRLLEGDPVLLPVRSCFLGVPDIAHPNKSNTLFAGRKWPGCPGLLPRPPGSASPSPLSATPLTRGRRSQVWDGRVLDQDGTLVATGRVRLICVEGGSPLAGEPAGVKG